MKPYVVNGLKKLYSFYVKGVSLFYSNRPKRKQVTYLLSFPNNDRGLIEKLNNRYSLTVYYTNNCQDEASKLAQLGIHTCRTDTMLGLTKAIKDVTESRVVICDNYVAFLGDIQKSTEQTIFQIWHATGAIKTFGYEDKQVSHRTQSDKKRFTRVYQQFDYVVVGSKAMGNVFKTSYGMKEEQILYFGFPRTDYLVQQKPVRQTGKKKILYLPTYREKEGNKSALDVNLMRRELQESYQLLIKHHPHVSDKGLDDAFVSYIDASQSADELLADADVLVTDYSSTAFDYALSHPEGKLVFYWYDEEAYREQTGIQKEVEESFPLPVAKTTLDIVTQIKCEDAGDMTSFNQMWNTYNDGLATERLLEAVKNKMDGTK